MILVVSDVHLGFKKCNRKDFISFLKKFRGKDIENLVLLGDIFDFWRRNNAQIVEENEEVMERISDLDAKKVHYIAGNHDYYILTLNKMSENNENKFTVSKYLRLESGGENFFFVHGYQLESILWEFPASLEMYEKFSNEMCYNQDFTGSFLSIIWDLKELFSKKRRFTNDMDKEPHKRKNIDEVYKLAVSSAKYLLLGMQPTENLVFGHTHRPFISKDKKVVNTGSWINEIKKKYQNSFVEIDDGKMDLKFF
ncbi:MAG: UDP-2,3-diacylglucosamine diphosphatase [Candidatus Subteraquimicrobiales bacterium]|nr:UDP-2,3-diacylglucosamine diphosphatase [Candidatus Subteraquimicrobiales bacterium]